MTPVTITKENFAELVERAEKPVLVDFWAPWCVYCRRIGPAVDQIAQQYDGQLVVGKVNIDEQPDWRSGSRWTPSQPAAVPGWPGGGAPDRPRLQGPDCGLGRPVSGEEVGMSTAHYDVAVIGGGPGGYTAALYCARSGRSVVVLEKLSAGGQMATTDQVDNYPGFDEGINGFELAERMERQAQRFGAVTVYAEVTGVELSACPKRIESSEGEFTADAVVLATGASPRELGLPGEGALRGRGVAYCATCDGMFFKDKTVAVAGGGNTAVEDALYLSRL